MAKSMIKQDSRSKACKIAKLLAHQRGAHPCKYLKDGWRIVKGEITLEAFSSQSGFPKVTPEEGR